MLQKIAIPLFIITIVGIISCCNFVRQNKVREMQKTVEGTVKIGDDIFDAKKKLEAKGLKILANGPSYATQDKSYYSMVIDYGLQPTVWDTFKYALEISPSENQMPIYGLIEADENGKVYKIE